MFVERLERDSPAYSSFWERLGRGEFPASHFKRIGRGGPRREDQSENSPVFTNPIVFKRLCCAEASTRAT